MAMPEKVTINTLKKMKQKGEKIAMLTAYDYFSAKIFDSAGIDILLVGDTLGMVFAGHQTTLNVRIDQMAYHCEIVSRGTKRALVIGDMPFLTYQVTQEDAVRNAGMLVQDGNVQAVKLEGGRSVIPVIKRILRAGIPVMGHLGLTPQSVHKFGGWKVQGKDTDTGKRIQEAASALEEAGCFAIVLEAIPAELAGTIRDSLDIPVIGIGAGPHCDGQVLVSADMLGITDFQAKYLKKYADMSTVMHEGVEAYIDEVKNGKFPGMENSY
jgi:3-methyl-2-oxobutanoate hydroxymethyltransferase